MGRRLMGRVVYPEGVMFCNMTPSLSPYLLLGFPLWTGLLPGERIFLKQTRRRRADRWEVGGTGGGLLIFERILLKNVSTEHNPKGQPTLAYGTVCSTLPTYGG